MHSLGSTLRVDVWKQKECATRAAQAASSCVPPRLHVETDVTMLNAPGKRLHIRGGVRRARQQLREAATVVPSAPGPACAPTTGPPFPWRLSATSRRPDKQRLRPRRSTSYSRINSRLAMLRAFQRPGTACWSTFGTPASRQKQPRSNVQEGTQRPKNLKCADDATSAGWLPA